MKVLLLSKYARSGASSRLRTLQFIPGLAAQGIQVTPASLFNDRYLTSLYQRGARSTRLVASLYAKRLLNLTRVGSFDLIWLEKEMFPYLPATFERVLALSGIPYVVDYDDAIFHNYDLSANWLLKTLLRSKIDRVMRHSACVVAGNRYLANRAVEAGASKVIELPTVVDLSRYNIATPASRRAVKIGWVGSPSTQRYLLDVLPVLQHMSGRYDIRLILVGAHKDFASELSKRVSVENLSWTEATEVESIHQFDIGIMPLPDSPWERGKCGYKLIQYMACGIPVVASDVGANRSIVAAGFNGFLATNETDWIAALTELVEDPSLRLSFGREARRAVESCYSTDAVLPRLTETLRCAAGNRT